MQKTANHLRSPDKAIEAAGIVKQYADDAAKIALEVFGNTACLGNEWGVFKTFKLERAATKPLDLGSYVGLPLPISGMITVDAWLRLARWSVKNVRSQVAVRTPRMPSLVSSTR